MVTDTLKERGEIYGDYGDAAMARAHILQTLTTHHKVNNEGEEMESQVVVALGDIVMKLVRVAASPEHTDSLHDLAGYSTLLERILVEKSR